MSHIQRANERYNIKITDFEGPLDLLLHLIRESKLDIKTIPLASVTAQYLEILTQLNSPFCKGGGEERAGGFLDLASEFVEVGATLVEIKARGILPKPATEDEETDDPEQRLRAQLEEYKLLKEAGEKLKLLENVDRFYKPPPELKPEYKYVLDNLSVDDLVSAFTRIMHKMQKSAAPVTSRNLRLDRFTVRDKIRDIRTRLQNFSHGEGLNFSDLFEPDFTKSEMINTFLAVLELLKTQEIKAKQDSAFADIQITKGEHNDILEVYDEYTVIDVAD